MTPEQARELIDTMLKENGLAMSLHIIDGRNGIDVTMPVSKQWQYVPIATVVYAPISEGNDIAQSPATE